MYIYHDTTELLFPSFNWRKAFSTWPDYALGFSKGADNIKLWNGASQCSCDQDSIVVCSKDSLIRTLWSKASRKSWRSYMSIIFGLFSQRCRAERHTWKLWNDVILLMHCWSTGIRRWIAQLVASNFKSQSFLFCYFQSCLCSFRFSIRQNSPITPLTS